MYKSHQKIQNDVILIQNKELKSSLKGGIGIHHAGLSTEEKVLVEDLFKLPNG